MKYKIWIWKLLIDIRWENIRVHYKPLSCSWPAPPPFLITQARVQSQGQELSFKIWIYRWSDIWWENIKIWINRIRYLVRKYQNAKRSKGWKLPSMVQEKKGNHKEIRFFQKVQRWRWTVYNSLPLTLNLTRYHIEQISPAKDSQREKYSEKIADVNYMRSLT